MAILWPKIGQRHFGARASHGHNLAIFHQILTNEHTKMTSSLRRIEWNTILSSIFLFYILVFWPHFCSEASHGQCCTYGLKTTLKLLVHVLAIMASSYLKIVFQQKSGLNPPPPPPPPPLNNSSVAQRLRWLILVQLSRVRFLVSSFFILLFWKL